MGTTRGANKGFRRLFVGNRGQTRHPKANALYLFRNPISRQSNSTTTSSRLRPRPGVRIKVSVSTSWAVKANQTPQNQRQNRQCFSMEGTKKVVSIIIGPGLLPNTSYQYQNEKSTLHGKPAATCICMTFVFAHREALEPKMNEHEHPE